jgi:hypothetical protein
MDIRMFTKKKTLDELLTEKLKDRSPKTIKVYVLNFKKTVRETDINDADKLKDYLMEKKVNTRQNYLWSIKNVLELQSDPNKEVLSMIQNLIDSGKKEIDSYYQEQKKTKRESDNWISLKKLQEFNKNQKKALMTTTNKFTKTPNKKELKNWLITSLYTLDPENHPPMRIDYNMEIIKSRDEIKQGNNYLLLESKSKKYFIFDDYKTGKSQGTKEIKLSRKMNSVMNIYLKFNPDNKYLFQNNKGENISKNALQKLIQKVYLPLDKKIGVTLLRHIIISETLDTGDKLKKKQELADKMGHSTQTQEKYKKFE